MPGKSSSARDSQLSSQMSNKTPIETSVMGVSAKNYNPAKSSMVEVETAWNISDNE